MTIINENLEKYNISKYQEGRNMEHAVGEFRKYYGLEKGEAL